jgi:hypothetical protein
LKASIAELEAACGQGEMEDEQEGDSTESAGTEPKKAMIIAMMKKKMGTGE